MKHFYHLLEFLFLLFEPLFAEATVRPASFAYESTISEIDPIHGGKDSTLAGVLGRNGNPATPGAGKAGGITGHGRVTDRMGLVVNAAVKGPATDSTSLAAGAAGGLNGAALGKTASSGKTKAKDPDLVDLRRPGAAPVLRIYEDDDFFNIRGIGTDEGYTNGTRLDYFYVKHHPDRQADRWLMPDAGKGAINTYGWGLMEIMYTPTNLKAAQYLPNNYAYAGAMYLAHTKYSYNRQKRFSFETELAGGLMGPSTAAGPIQSWFHGVINYQRPEGWKNQFPDDILLNENLTVEKELAHLGRGLEWIAGATGNIGTMLDGATAFSTIRVGWMNPYFDGWNTQFQGLGKRKVQFYLFGTPKAEWVAFNSMLEGGLVTRETDKEEKARFANFGPRVKRGVAEIDYGWVIVYKGFSAAYTQKTGSATLKGMGMHEVGNISFFITLH